MQQPHAIHSFIQPAPDRPAATRPAPNWLGAGPKREALSHEPAHLAPPPKGQHLGRFQSSHGGFVQRVSHWRVANRELPALIDHYRRQAHQRDLQPLFEPTPTPAQTQATLLFQSNPNAQSGRRTGGVLAVHLTEANEAVRVTVSMHHPVEETQDRPAAANELGSDE
jgi:hypothetical protein